MLPANHTENISAPIVCYAECPVAGFHDPSLNTPHPDKSSKQIAPVQASAPLQVVLPVQVLFVPVVEGACAPMNMNMNIGKPPKPNKESRSAAGYASPAANWNSPFQATYPPVKKSAGRGCCQGHSCSPGGSVQSLSHTASFASDDTQSSTNESKASLGSSVSWLGLETSSPFRTEENNPRPSKHSSSGSSSHGKHHRTDSDKHKRHSKCNCCHRAPSFQSLQTTLARATATAEVSAGAWGSSRLFVF
ncbi:hypothetical protein M427DRAFT_53506, partial [Gonapodya prolifera JEL478]